MQSKEDRREGFTLVELCIVLALMGFLIFLCLPTFAHMQEESADHTAKQELGLIRDAYLLAKSIAVSNGRLAEPTYEITVHQDSQNAYEQYFNEKVDSMLEQNILGHYTIQEQSVANTSNYIIHYYQNNKTYQLANGQFSIVTDASDEQKPSDPIQQATVAGSAMADTMKDLCKTLLGKSLDQKKAYFAAHGFELSNNNMSNDIYRKFLFTYVHKGTWPSFDEDFKTYHHLTNDYYIQPYVYDISCPEDVITFATGNNSPQAGWYTGMIYHKDEGVWYTGPSFSIANHTWEEIKANIEANWHPLRSL